MRKYLTFAAVMALAVVMSCGAAFAEGAGIRSIKYNGNGNVVIRFMQAIKRSPSGKITVRDSNGNVVPARIVKNSGSEMYVKVPNAQKGQKYTFDINGMNVGQQRNMSCSNQFEATPRWNNNNFQNKGPQNGQQWNQNKKPRPQNGQPGQQQNGQPGQPGQQQNGQPMPPQNNQ